MSQSEECFDVLMKSLAKKPQKLLVSALELLKNMRESSTVLDYLARVLKNCFRGYVLKSHPTVPTDKAEKITTAINEFMCSDKSSSSMVSEWCIKVLGELSQEFSIHKMLPGFKTKPSTPQELLNFWTSCPISKSLVSILCNSLSNLKQDEMYPSFDLLLTNSTKFFPYFNWVLECTKSQVLDVTMIKMLECRLNSYYQNANAQQTSLGEVVMPTTESMKNKDLDQAVKKLQAKVDLLEKQLESSNEQNKTFKSENKRQRAETNVLLQKINNLQASKLHAKISLESLEKKVNFLKDAKEELNEKARRQDYTISVLELDLKRLKENSVQMTSTDTKNNYADIVRLGVSHARTITDLLKQMSHFTETQSSIFLRGYLGTRQVMVRNIRQNYRKVFQKETAALKRLKDHRNINPVCFSLDSENELFIVSDQQEMSLDKQVLIQSLKIDEKISFLKQLLEILILLETVGIAHQYIIPRHILVSTEVGGYKHLFLSNFERSTMTIQNNSGPNLAHPEVQTEEGSHLADVHAMGEIIFLTWTGKKYNTLSKAEIGSEMSILPKEVGHLVHSMTVQNNKPASILRRFPCFWDVDVAKRFFTSTSKLTERSKDVRDILSEVEHDFKNRCDPNIKACMLDVESYDDTLYGFVWWYRNLVEHFHEIKTKANSTETTQTILQKTWPNLCDTFDLLLPWFDTMFTDEVWPELSKDPLITVKKD